jgi:nicotinate-nucleotide adenylyltransferase
MNVAFYGGSFNPPHVGHVLAAAYLTSVAGFDRVLVVPVFEHAFDKHLATFDHRVQLCDMAFSRLPDVEVSTIESELSAPSYTISTVKLLLTRHPDWRLRVVVGADVLPEIERWHAVDELRRLAPFYVLGRRGVSEAAAPPPLLPEVSSSQIRSWCAQGSDNDAELARLLPAPVLEAIHQWGLYRCT